MRENKKKCLILLIALYVTISIVSAESDKYNAREILPDIIETLNKIENPVSGKGIASLKKNSNGLIEEGQINFIFKDEMSRTDVYSVSDSENKGERVKGWIRGTKYSVLYNDHSATIKATPSSAFDRRVGNDFHPNTYLQLETVDRSIAAFLDRASKSKSIIEINQDEDILEINMNYEGEKQHEHFALSVDTAKEFRPVYFKQAFEYPENPEENGLYTCRYEWKKYGSDWYISSIRQNSEGMGGSFDAETGTSEKYRVTKNIEIFIQEFVPNAEIDEKEFTLSGLNLKPGTLIKDQIAGLDYYLGSEMPNPAKLKAFFENAKFPRKIYLFLIVTAFLISSILLTFVALRNKRSR
jgi:hypothetical protein